MATKSLKAKEIRSMKKEDLAKRVAELRKELMKLRSQVASKTQLENPGRIRTIKRTLARIYTIEHEQRKEVKA